MRFKPSQEKVVNQIVDEGFSRGVPEESMSIVATTAFQESTFNEAVKNSKSSAIGVFQFLVAPWDDRHKHLDRNNTTHQIKAMYDDVAWFRKRYSEHLTEGRIDGSMPFIHYAYASHAAGPSCAFPHEPSFDPPSWQLRSSGLVPWPAP